MFTLVDLSIGLLRQVEGPVGNVEERENGGENNAGQDVDLFGARGELVEPGLEKVFAFARLVWEDSLSYIYIYIQSNLVTDGSMNLFQTSIFKL